MNLISRYEFRPGLGASLATLILLPVLLGLGFWQLERAAEKQAIQTEFSASYNKPAVVLNDFQARDEAGQLRWRQVIISGQYTGTAYLLDNQVYRGEPGYRVYAPLKLSGSDDIVLVERDWRPLGRDRQQVPDIDLPQSEMHLQGRVVPTPATGIMLGEHRIQQMTEQRYRVQRIKPTELASHSGMNLLPYVVRLDNARHAGDDRRAALNGFGSERHLGYAFQWFALAVTLVIIYLCVNIKRRHQDHE